MELLAKLIEELRESGVGLAFLFAAGGYVLSAAYVPRVLLRRREPSATLAWLFAIIVFPYVGVLLYIVFGNNRVHSRREAKRRSDTELGRSIERLRERFFDSFPDVEPSLFAAAKNLGLPPPAAGNRVMVYTDGPSAFEALLARIESARHHAHLEFFLFRQDETGRCLLETLCAAARRGVEIRLLVDAVGLFMGQTKESFFDPLRKAGGQMVRFLPVGLVRGWSFFNLRNHRKLTVVDGRLAFTGGMNVGDEYSGLSPKDGPAWRDILLEVEGPAAALVQEVFAADWYFATGEGLAAKSYFPPAAPAGQDVVQVVASGPDESLGRLHLLTLALLAGAQKSISIATPYFVPDPALAAALATAALRGIDVRLLVPRRSNHLLAEWAGRSYYEELLEAGVQIQEFLGGMLHAKAVVVDGNIASVGSANMDVRSFRLNFELNLIVHGAAFAGQIEKTLREDTKASERLTLERFSQRPLLSRYFETGARILSPVL
ncbi:MAG: cardiolipin synthase [Bdellovibrionota bacterium]